MKEVLVVAHDAGAAEVIAAYIRTQRSRTHFHVYAAGPALKIMRREHIAYYPIADNQEDIARIISKHTHVSFVLLGTGWMTHIESRALAEAKKRGLRTAVYLESWGDYRRRFGYPKPSWRKSLPHELWVGDHDAMRLAQKHFPRSMLRFVKNQYLAKIVSQVKKKKVKPNRILVMSRPQKEMENIVSELVRGVSQPLWIRLHPADKPNRYQKIFKQFGSRVKKSREKDIVKDLSSARVVVGTETVAMAISALAGIKTISILRPGQKPLLPQKNIIRVTGPRRALKYVL